jgi:hypothetical protein
MISSVMEASYLAGWFRPSRWDVGPVGAP